MKPALVICLLMGLAAVSFGSFNEDLDDWNEARNEIEKGDETWSSLDRNIFESIKLFNDDNTDERGLSTKTVGSGECSCGNNVCKCCAHAVHDLSICIQLEVHFQEKTMDVSIVANDKSLITETVSIKKAEQICDRLPFPMKFIKICLEANVSETSGGIQSCPTIEVLAGFFSHVHSIAKIPFSCIHFSGDYLSMNDAGSVPADDSFKIDDPINHHSEMMI